MVLSYSGYLSQNGFTWTQLGSTIDLEFGAGINPSYAGFAITSHNNAALSVATADNYLQSTALPVRLVSFTGRNINDQYVSLNWTT